MRTMNYVITFAILLFLVGCKTQVQTSAQDTSQNKQVPAQQAPPKVAQNETPKTSDISSEFMQKFANRASMKWKVSYDIKTSYNGQNMNTQMTQYMKSTNMMRMDMMAQGIEARTYMSQDVYTSCTKQGEGWKCFKIDVPKDQVKQTEKDIQTNADKYTITDDGTKTIAGTVAKCYKVVSKDNTMTIRYCFSSEGVPLYVNVASPQGSSEMTATSYTTSVSDSDFEVPAASTTTTMPSPSSAQDPCAACNYLTGTDKDQCLASCK